MDEDYFYRQLALKEKEIRNLKWLMWSSIIIVALFTNRMTVYSFSGIDRINVIIGLIMYFFIAFTIGQHNEWIEQEIYGLYLLVALFLLYIGSLLNLYLCLITLAVLLSGYFAGHFYRKIVGNRDEEYL